jgi:protein-S-isoprenylcysteine O-methyltransferase Ste14
MLARTARADCLGVAIWCAMLFVRAVLAFLLLPGIVAFLLPALVLDPPAWERPFGRLGFVPLVPGLALLLWCAWAFYRRGRGTLAPWDPPRALVASGVYAVSRNPMYVAVVLVLLGWAVGYRSMALALYALAAAVVFHLRVVFFEEPFLARTHGDEWTRYRARVPRWIGHPRRRGPRNGA